MCVATPDGGIRPTYKQQQHTVILRDVPSSTPQDAILNILREKGCTGYKSIRSELNDTWFITFESEQDARDSIFAIRDATLDGKPIRARLKTESIAKSFYQAAMEQAQTQPWQSTPVVQFPPANVPQQRFHQNRARHEFSPHQTHGGGSGGSGGPRNGRNRSRRQFNTVPPVDAPNAYHAMRMQAMWAAQFGHQMAAAPMMPMPPQQFVQAAEPAPRGRRSGSHGGSRSSASSAREDGREQRRPQPEGVPPVGASNPVALNGTGPHAVVAPHVAATSAAAVAAVPMATPTSPLMRAPHSHDGKTASAGDEAHSRRGSGGGQQPRPRRASGPNQRRDSDAAAAAAAAGSGGAAASPRNIRSDGGKKPAGKKKPQQPSRKSERKPAESAPGFTEADFPVLSTVKPSTSATDLASGTSPVHNVACLCDCAQVHHLTNDQIQATRRRLSAARTATTTTARLCRPRGRRRPPQAATTASLWLNSPVTVLRRTAMRSSSSSRRHPSRRLPPR